MAQNQDSVTDAEDIKVSTDELNAVDLFKDIDPNNATPEQVQKVIETGKTLLVQKKGWRAKAQVLPPTPEPQNPSVTPPQAADGEKETDARIKRLESVEEKRQFQHLHNLSPEETDHVFAYSQGVGIKPTEALEKPFMKTALQAFRSAQQNDGATPGPSHRSPRVEGKTFSEMTTDEKRKNFSEVVKNIPKK